MESTGTKDSVELGKGAEYEMRTMDASGGDATGKDVAGVVVHGDVGREEIRPSDERRASASSSSRVPELSPQTEAGSSSQTPPLTISPALRPPRDPASPTSAGDIVPDSIGRETCPICIVDFEEGDDLRILPCEGKHRFHQECVDQWLLELSGSCPICRQGAFTPFIAVLVCSQCE